MWTADRSLVEDEPAENPEGQGPERDGEMTITPAERKALDELSRIHESSKQVPALVLQPVDGQFHYAFLDPFQEQEKLNQKKNGNPDKKTNGSTTGKIPTNRPPLPSIHKGAGRNQGRRKKV
jgi:hypothetical protein